jgi:hypothetical protein
MDHNPYSPPAAVVSDAVIARGKRPLSITIALALLAVGLARQGWGLLSELRFASAGEASPIAVVILAFRVALFAWIWMAIARGRNWARHTTLALILFSAGLFILRTGVLFPVVPEGVKIQYDPAAVVLAVLPHACAFVALYLLYFPGRRWFRAADA